MSDYVYESGMSSRRRRQRRTAITLLLTLLLLGGAFYWAWSYIRDGGSSAAAPADATSTAVSTECPDVPDPRTVTVNVYNSTSIGGLAGRIADELTERGYSVGEVANDPQAADIAQPAELRYGDPGRPFAAILKTIVVEPNLRPDGREDTSVDLVLGNGFTELSPIPAGLPTC